MHCDLTFPKKLAGYSVWTYYVNDFDGVMNFECQDGNIVTGIGAYHSKNMKTGVTNFGVLF